MSDIIIKQSNGKYAVYSTVEDNIIAYDCTREDLVNDLCEESKKRHEDYVKDRCDYLDEYGKTRHGGIHLIVFLEIFYLIMGKKNTIK